MKLHIDAMVYGGAGLAYPVTGQGEAVAVPFTLPGEVVEASLTGAGQGALVQVLEASGDRVTAGCRHFEVCGGCQYQHATYAAQVAMKAGILRAVLEGVGIGEVPKVQVHSGAAWGYRNRIQLRVGDVDGVLRVGYSLRGTNEMLAIAECPIAAPVLWRAAEALLAVAKLPAGRLVKDVAEVEFFTVADESRVQMTLFMKKLQRGGLADLGLAMRKVLPELVGAGTAVMRDGARSMAKAGEGWGVEGLQYEAVGRKYWVGRGSFFQVNRFMVETLVGLVSGSRQGTLAWDLYAGVGLFSQALAERFTDVVAVEVGDSLKSFKGKGKWGLEGTTVEFLRVAVVQRERPDLVVVDPPRAGLGSEVCALLSGVKAKEMVYVSCDPETLARDVAELVKAGYRVAAVHMVDLFPQTFHLESVVVLVA